MKKPVLIAGIPAMIRVVLGAMSKRKITKLWKKNTAIYLFVMIKVNILVEEDFVS